MMTPHNNSLSTVEMFSLHEGAPDLMTLHIIPLWQQIGQTLESWVRPWLRMYHTNPFHLLMFFPQGGEQVQTSSLRVNTSEARRAPVSIHLVLAQSRSIKGSLSHRKLHLLWRPIPKRGMLRWEDSNGSQAHSTGSEKIRIWCTKRLFPRKELHRFRAGRGWTGWVCGAYK